MRVKLIAHTTVVDDVPGYIPHTSPSIPSACDDLGEQAGRLCYLSWNRPHAKTSTNKGYLRNITDQGHYSVMEHSSASFYIDEVTRAFLLELERHRHFSYSVVSQRYVDGTEFDMIQHPELAKLSWGTKLRINGLKILSHLLYSDIVAELKDLGDDNKTARGAARLVLPEGTETRLLVTGNMRAWREFLWKRLSKTADTEIRDVAKLIVAELKQIAPNTFQDFE